MKNKKAVSITELIIVVILLGILAGFAIPNYRKSLQRSAEKDAAYNLAHVTEALQLWRSIAQTTNIDAATWTLPDINSKLNLGIAASGDLTYSCLQTEGADSNVCKAVHTDGWVIHLHDNGTNATEPHCAAGGCPTCTNSTSTGCSHYFQ